MYCIFLIIILSFNYLHRLQSIISEVFILITLIMTILYSPIYLPLECKFFFRMLSVKNYFLDQFLYKVSKYKSFKNISQEDFFIKNYFSYQKNEIHDVTQHVYIVSHFSKNFFQILSDDKVVDIHEVDALLRQYPILNNLKFGQVISLIMVKKHGLRSLLWQVSSNESRIYNRIPFTNRFMENIILKLNGPEKWNYIMVIGRLHDNFINSARSLGLDEKHIHTVITSLQWQLDFHKLRLGDKFAILIISPRYTDNHINVNDVNWVVVAVRLRSVGRDYYAFRADNGRYYNREAIGMGHDFIKLPTIKPFRISSNFSLNRLNPITGRISPHFGVDFAVPIGTPILSIGDGKVVVSKYGRVPGNYIVIRHGPYCISRYMHLNRLLVKPGQIVKKGENIAFSGNTGRSTGPHLHFEVWVNHKPINPLTAAFLNVEKLSGHDRINYIQKISLILPYLHFDQ